MMGVTFASVGPMLSMAAVPDVGLAWHLWVGHRRRRLAVLVVLHGEAFAAVPAGGDRHDDLVIGVSLMRVGINGPGAVCRP